MSLIQHLGLQDNAASTTVVAAVGNTGTLAGGDNTNTLSVAGPGGSYTRALDLDGAGDHVSFTGHAISGTGTWTWWAKRDSTGTVDSGHGSPTGSGATNRIAHEANGTQMSIRMIHSGTTATPSHGVTTTAWHHYAIVRDSSNIVSLYVDGSLVNSNVFSGPMSGSADWGNVGAFAGGTSSFDGAIADARIYNSDESANIATIYADGVGGGAVENPAARRFGINRLGRWLSTFRPVEIGREGATIT